MRTLLGCILAPLAFLTTLGAETSFAQLVRDHDGQGLRSFHGQTSRIRRSFQSDAEAHAVFKQILAVSGLAGMEDRIVIRASAETANAEAFIERTPDKEERLIFYNAEFMASVARKDKNYWSMVAILAHEVGHHIRFHTLIPGRDHEFELEADYQAGFILRRMGATLEQAQAAFRTIGPEIATPSHPAGAQRVQAATLGWTDGVSVQASSPPAQNRTQLFDGAWIVTMVCPQAADGAQGYTRSLVAQVKDGVLRAQSGERDRPNWLLLAGNIEPDGAAWIDANGLTGPSASVVGRPAPGTPFTFAASARFEGAQGAGSRIGGRECNLAFAKQSPAQPAEASQVVASPLPMSKPTPDAQKGPFDGVWKVTGVGGPGCSVKDRVHPIRIDANKIFNSKSPLPGTVQPNGDFEYTAPPRDPNAPLGSFSGKLSGGSGTGHYNFSNVCVGSIELKRAEEASTETRGIVPIARDLLTERDLQRVSAIGKKHSLVLPSFEIEALGQDVPPSNRKFLGIWASEIGFGGRGRQAMLIITRVDSTSKVSGINMYGPPTATSFTKGPAGFNYFELSITGDKFSWTTATQTRTATLIPSGDVFVKEKRADGRETAITLKPVWTLVAAERSAKK